MPFPTTCEHDHLHVEFEGAVSPELVEYAAALAKGGSYSNAHLKLASSASRPECRKVVTSYIDCVKALAGTWDIRLFGRPDEARGWLGL